eukprot:6189532-Pleurochrysis_carterae.AAC.2
MHGYASCDYGPLRGVNGSVCFSSSCLDDQADARQREADARSIDFRCCLATRNRIDNIAARMPCVRRDFWRSSSR